MSDGVRVLTEAEAVNRESARRRAAARAERRERIASEVYAAMVLGNFVAFVVSNGSMSLDPSPEDAMERANDLMAALDAAEARDAEATK